MPADIRIQVKPPAGAEPRHATRRKATALEAEILAHYPAGMRRDLLRRWRAKELYVRDDGRLALVDPEVRARARQAVAAAAARNETKRRRRQMAAGSRSRNRGRR